MWEYPRMNFSIFARGAALASVFALAACGGTSADTDGDGKISQDEVEAAVAAVEITPGEWENTVEFTDIQFDKSKLPPEAQAFIVPMLESMKGQVQTSKSCVTEEEASKPQAEMFSGNEDADCEYTKFEFSGGQMDMAMTCNDPQSGTAKITNTGSYSADAYDMKMTVELEDNEMGAMTITAASTGKHLGACPAE
ncbi:MAG: hypothetical protein CL955_04185 [Erythrobacteraceae bacterium]|nr:hypothetical protein [Erythrobacteraceae bacterium]